MLTAILWLLLQLKWFNIHLLVPSSYVRMVLVLPGIWLIQRMCVRDCAQQL